MAAVLLAGCSEADSTSDIEIKIVTPTDGETVPAGKPVRIEAEVVGGDVAESENASDAGHLHIFVDGDLQEMLYATATEVTLKPGPHTITVEYTDDQHLSLDNPVKESVEVVAERES